MERWACYDLMVIGPSKPLVILTREEGDVGEVRIGGKAHTAFFEFAGLDRRWNFGINLARLGFYYAVVILPSGRA